MTAAGTVVRGRYRLVELLGEGSQGRTWRAVDEATGHAVALKLFEVRGARSWKDVELAEREARVLATLRHPALPAYRDHFEDEGRLCLVMDLVEGESLARLAKRGARLGPDEVRRLLADLGDALAYLHGLAPPVVHRDVKPGNVLRRPDGSFALVDFGAVRDRLRADGGSTVVGTFGYMAPEQVQGRALPQTDVYGLGATVIAALTGEEPERLPHRGLALDVRAALGPGADPALVSALEAMLAPDPDQRAARVPELGARGTRSAPPPRSAAGEPGDAGAAADFDAPPWERLGPPWTWSRRERRRWKKEWKHRSRAERDAIRAAWRRDAHASGEEWVSWWLVRVGLALAQLAVAFALGFAVPLVLFVLSIVLGPGLRRAARRVAEAGASTERRLAELRRGVRGPGPPPAAATAAGEAPATRTRVRVEPEPATRRGVRVPPPAERIEGDWQPPRRGRERR